MTNFGVEADEICQILSSQTFFVKADTKQSLENSTILPGRKKSYFTTSAIDFSYARRCARRASSVIKRAFVRTAGRPAVCYQSVGTRVDIAASFKRSVIS